MTVEFSNGLASGWSVFETDRGWQWSAFAPGGANYGKASSKEQAERLAHLSLVSLKRLPPPS